MRSVKYTTKSGEVLTLTPVNQMELAPLTRKILELQPQPPVEVVQTANGPKEVSNEAHPDYLRAKTEFEATQGMYMFAALIELGVDVELTAEQEAEVKRRQKKYRKLFGELPQNEFDTYVYVTTLCDQEELSEIANRISSINSPTAQQVQSHVDAFRVGPGVPGPSDNEDKDAPKWNNLPEPELDLDALPGGEVLGNKPNSLLRTIGPRVAG